MSDLSTASGLRAGTTIGGYRVLRTEPVQHVEGTFVELVHERTGARHLHVACPDDNNAFAVAFATVPQDSTGVAHILEHVVLAGSRKYPAREPFFAMLNRSLATFMNAFTGADATVYPFSTRNRKDFFNLLAVYLDATFHPRLDEGSFMQEGHRLEFLNTEDPSSGLRHKGVVYNEMKGARSTAPAILDKAIGAALFPSLTYAFDSGGDPEKIVDLTWEQLKRFHATHYHPSLAAFFTAGDIPMAEILEVIEREVMTGVEPLSERHQIGDERPFDAPVAHQALLPVADLTVPQGQALVAWATVLSADTYEVLKFRLLSEVLLGNPGAPLRRALVESGIGEALADLSGFRDSTRQAQFVVGLKGIAVEDAEKVQALVLETLERIAAEGLDPELVEAALHQVEIAQREVSNAGFPYSLKLALEQVGAQLYGGDPYRALRLDQDLERLAAERLDGPVLEDTIRRVLLENNHRALVVLAPETGLEARKEAAELAALAAIEAALSDTEKQEIVRVTTRLREEQERDESADKALLPDLDLSDIPTSVTDPEARVVSVGGAEVHFYPLPTNGFVYFDVVADFSSLPLDLKDDLGLFAYAFSRSGAAQDDYVALARRMDRYTGGIRASATTVPQADGEGFLQWFRVQGKALARNSREYTDLLRDMVGSVTFERGRLKDIIAEYRAQLETSVAFGGTQYAVSLANASLSARGALNDRLGGLSFVRRMRHLGTLAEEDLGEVLAGLERTRSELFDRGRVRLVITAEEKALGDLETMAAEVVGVLGSAAGTNGHVAPEPLPAANRARTWAVPVAYNAVARTTVPYTHHDAAPLVVLGQVLRESFVHPEVREKGGAYGGQVLVNAEGGTFAFGSYRDPNIARTYGVFERATGFGASEAFSPAVLKGAVLSASRGTDPLESPDTRGRRHFVNELSGFSLKVREQFKARLLATTEDDLHRVARLHLVDRPGVMATVGNAEKIDEANREMGGVFEVEPV